MARKQLNLNLGKYMELAIEVMNQSKLGHYIHVVT